MLIHRPDGSLFFYGFVSEQDRPLLCATDLPPGYPPQSLNDALYDGELIAHDAVRLWDGAVWCVCHCSAA